MITHTGSTFSTIAACCGLSPTFASKEIGNNIISKSLIIMENTCFSTWEREHTWECTRFIDIVVDKKPCGRFQHINYLTALQVEDSSKQIRDVTDRCWLHRWVSCQKRGKGTICTFWIHQSVNCSLHIVIHLYCNRNISMLRVPNRIEQITVPLWRWCLSVRLRFDARTWMCHRA